MMFIVEVARPVNRTIDVSFSSKIQTCIRGELGQHRADSPTIANIAEQKQRTRIVLDFSKIQTVPYISELVEHYYLPIAMGEDEPYEIRPYEASSACY
jgi:hypothetical protein